MSSKRTRKKLRKQVKRMWHLRNLFHWSPCMFRLRRACILGAREFLNTATPSRSCLDKVSSFLTMRSSFTPLPIIKLGARRKHKCFRTNQRSRFKTCPATHDLCFQSSFCLRIKGASRQPSCHIDRDTSMARLQCLFSIRTAVLNKVARD